MEEIKIERLNQTDLDEVLELALATPELWDTDEPGYFEKEDLARLLDSPHDICLKATVDGKFVGYRLATYHPFLKGAYLMDVAVKSEYRGQGIASALYEETERLLKEKGCLWAWALVYEKNAGMMKFIEKKGYHQGRKWFTYYKELD